MVPLSPKMVGLGTVLEPGRVRGVGASRLSGDNAPWAGPRPTPSGNAVAAFLGSVGWRGGLRAASIGGNADSRRPPRLHRDRRAVAGRRGVPAVARGPLGRITGDLLTSRSGGQKGTPPAQMRGLIRRAAAGGGQRATSRLSFCARPKRLSSARTPPPSLWPSSDGASLAGVASDAVSATGVAAAAGRSAEERRAAGFAGAEVPRILSTSFNALISACRRSISLCLAAIAFAITLMGFFRGCIVNRSTRPARPSASMGADSSPTRARRPDGARSPSTLAAAVLARVRTWLSRGADGAAAPDRRNGGPAPRRPSPRLAGGSPRQLDVSSPPASSRGIGVVPSGLVERTSSR